MTTEDIYLLVIVGAMLAFFAGGIYIGKIMERNKNNDDNDRPHYFDSF